MESRRRFGSLVSALQHGTYFNDCRAVHHEKGADGVDYLYVAGYGANAVGIAKFDGGVLTFVGGVQDNTQLRFANGVYAEWPWLWVSCGGEVGDFESRVTKVNITDRATPVVATTVVDTAQLQGARKLVKHGDVLYVACQRGSAIATLDAATLAVLDHYTDPLLDTVHQVQVYDITGEGLTAFAVSAVGNALVIFDVSDPTNIVRRGYYQNDAVLGGAAGIKVRTSDMRAIVAAANVNRLPTFDVSDLDNPIFSTGVPRSRLHMENPQDVDISPDGRWAYVAGQNIDPLPGAAGDGGVPVVGWQEEERPRIVDVIRDTHTAWRGCRHIQAFDRNFTAVALRNGNGIGVITGAPVADRHLPARRLPLDFPAGWAHRWRGTALTGNPGDAIATWADDPDDGVTAARDLVQATAARKPLVRTLSAGGWRAADFDGVDDRMLTTDVTAINQPFTIVSAFTMDTLTNATRIFDTGSTGATVSLQVLTTGSPSNKMRITAGTTLDVGYITAAGARILVIAIFNGASSRVIVGMDTGSVSASGNAGTNPARGICAGARNNNGVFSAFLDGRIHDLVMYSGVPDLAELNQIGRAAANLYGSQWADLAA